MGYMEATRTGFMSLFNYISGANDGNVKIPMSAPVANKIQPGEGPNCVSNVTVAFFMTYDYQNGTLTLPKPTDKDVQLITTPAMTVAVRSFGGYTSDSKTLDNIATLGDALQKDKIAFVQEPFFEAGYDS